jgi:hypothetical protein
MQTPTKQQRTSTSLQQLFVSHRNLVALLVIDLVLFATAELTYDNAKRPGTISNIAWYAFLVGAASLVILAIRTIIPRPRRPAR